MPSEVPPPTNISVPGAAGSTGNPVHTDVKVGGRKKNSWLAHVKATMRGHRNKSFKQVLKIAKKTYKRSKRHSQSQSSQNGGKRRGSKKQQQKQQKQQQQQQQQQQQEQEQQEQQGGSGVGGGKEGMAAFGENASPVA
jgi:transcription initiation factor TFIID subunit TAF12